MKKRGVLGVFCAILITQISGSSTIVERENDVKRRAPCGELYDEINQKKITICGQDYLSYYPKKKKHLTNSYQLNTRLTNISYSKKKRYVEKSGKIEKHYDIYLPNDANDAIVTLFKKIPGIDFTFSSPIKYTETVSFKTGFSTSTEIGASISIEISSLLSSIKAQAGASISFVNEHYSETTYTTTIKQTFERELINGGSYEFRAEVGSYYYPIRVDRLRYCTGSDIDSENGYVCKGKNGSYVSDTFYKLVRVGDIHYVRCYNVNNTFFYDNTYTGTVTELSEFPGYNYRVDELSTVIYQPDEFIDDFI